MDITTMIGLALLAVGGYWAWGSKPKAPQDQLAELLKQLQPVAPVTIPAPQDGSHVAKVDRDRAVNAVEVLTDYFEQRGVSDATTHLHAIVTLIFTPTPKE
jgi:hypothetical protein